MMCTRVLTPRRLTVLLLGAAAFAMPAIAVAGNGLHPRTPVVWGDNDCLTVVDRSASATLNLSYEIPFEDTEVGEDEVADSRRHQFLAFCRDKDPQTVLPNWVAWADVVAAGEKPLDVEPDNVTDSQVLDLSPEWSDCFIRITDDADRRPITDAMAAMPVVWDTIGLQAGPWVVYGYTYEPAFNVYVRRPGIVQIVDDPAPAATGPAIAITTEEQILYKGGETVLEGCVSAMDGSTVDAYWSEAAETASWIPFLEDEPVMGQSVSIPFAAPEALTGKSGMIRVDVTDPMGRSYTTYMAQLVMVLQQQDPMDCDDGGSSFISNPGCGGSDGDSGGLDDTTGGDNDGDGDTTGGDETPVTTGPGADGGGDGGGKCSVESSSPAGPGVVLGIVALGLLGLRRRND